MGTRPFKTDIDVNTHKERIAEMAESLARESDLADRLYQALVLMRERRGIHLDDSGIVMKAIDQYESARAI